MWDLANDFLLSLRKRENLWQNCFVRIEYSTRVLCIYHDHWRERCILSLWNLIWLLKIIVVMYFPLCILRITNFYYIYYAFMFSYCTIFSLPESVLLKHKHYMAFVFLNRLTLIHVNFTVNWSHDTIEFWSIFCNCNCFVYKCIT